MSTTKKRFKHLYSIEQLTNGNSINLAGKQRAVAILGDGATERGDFLLLNTDVGVVLADSKTADYAAEVALLQGLERISDVKGHELESFYNQAITLNVAIDSPLGRQILRLQDEGARSVGVEIVELTAQQRVDQTTGEAIEGKYLFNYPIGGIKVYAVDWANVQASKPVASNATAAAEAVAIVPVRSLAERIAAGKNKQTAPPSSGVNPMQVAAIATKLGVAWSMGQMTAIAAKLTPQGLSMLEMATDETSANMALKFAGIDLSVAV